MTLDAHTRVIPCLRYRDAPAAIEWLCRAFGFTRRFVVEGPGDRVEHSELTLGTGVSMVSSSKPEDRRLKSQGEYWNPEYSPR